MILLQSYNEIRLRKQTRDEIFSHCLRKLEGRFMEGEAPEKKAYGLLGGLIETGAVHIRKCIPLGRNVRGEEPYKAYMDQMMEDHAVRSKTPLANRGWVADPTELFGCVRELRRGGLHLVGTYHMHIVPWEKDSVRDTPTHLDALLAARSGLIMFIVSMVDPARPLMRAFFEGDVSKEFALHLSP